MSEGDWVEVTPAQAEEERAAGRGREHRRLGHHRLAGEERARQQRPGGDVGDQLSRLLRAREHDRRAPRLEGGLAPGARRPTSSWATTATTTAPSCWPPTSASTCSSPAARAGPQPPRDGAAVRLRDPRRLRLLPPPGPSREHRSSTSGANPYYMMRVEHPTYDDFWKARNIAAHLKNIKHAVMTVGGWFDAEDLAGPLLTYRTIEQTSPGAVERHRDGALVARGLVAGRRRSPGQPGLRQQDRAPTTARRSSTRSSPGT